MADKYLSPDLPQISLHVYQCVCVVFFMEQLIIIIIRNNCEAISALKVSLLALFCNVQHCKQYSSVCFTTRRCCEWCQMENTVLEWSMVFLFLNFNNVLVSQMNNLSHCSLFVCFALRKLGLVQKLFIRPLFFHHGICLLCTVEVFTLVWFWFVFPCRSRLQQTHPLGAH